MSKSLEALFAAGLIALAPAAAGADGFGLGRAATEAEIAAWNIDVRPDGQGLPEGEGSVAEGEVIYTERCAICHGAFGEGAGRWPVLAGGEDSLTAARPVKTVGSYWPYLSTVFDYVHRAMPFGDAQSLTWDETYAVTAYILYLNFLADEDFVLTRENFTEVHLPNEDGFVADPRPDTPTLADGVPCMKDCRGPVEISMRAAVLNVTPDAADEDISVAEEPSTGSAPPAETSQATTEPAAAPEPAADPALVDLGEKVFRRCKACHQVGPDAQNRIGPQLNGVIGRRVGGLGDFDYSDAMAEAGAGGLVWNDRSLDAFLADPQGYMPGTKMGFAGLKAAEERAAIAAYLAQFPQ